MVEAQASQTLMPAITTGERHCNPRGRLFRAGPTSCQPGRYQITTVISWYLLVISWTHGHHLVPTGIGVQGEKAPRPKKPSPRNTLQEGVFSAHNENFKTKSPACCEPLL